MIKAIVFDLDGVLVDAADWHYQALNRALSLFGFSISSQTHTDQFNGLSTSLKLNKLSKESKLPTGLHSFINEMKQSFTQKMIASHCKFDPQVFSMLQALKEDGFKLALASNSLKKTVDSVLSQLSIRGFFDVILCQEDVKCAKPNPEIYLKAIQELKVEAWECLAVEDSVFGVQSAHAANLSVLKIHDQKEVGLNLVKDKVNELNLNHKDMPKIEIVIPMAGMGQRFKAAGYENPKPFIDVMGKPMIEWVIDNVKPKNYACHFTFICHEDHLKEFPVKEMLLSKLPDASIVSVKNTTEGAACTVLLAVEHLKHKRPLLLANSDQWVDLEIDSFIKSALDSNSDGMILTFEASDKKWSFAKLDSSNKVVEVAEKNPISNHATVGIYYFKHAEDFVAGAEEMIRKNIRTNNEFYVCPVYNELIKQNKNIQIFEIEAEKMNGLGTPEDLEVFLSRFTPQFSKALEPQILPFYPTKSL